LIFWPLFRTVKNIRQRGRLPDMKRKRVTITTVVIALILIAFFMLPLPIGRVRENGLVEVSEGHYQSVFIADNGILTEVFVHDGQEVSLGQDLASIRNPQYEFERKQYEKERDAAAEQMQLIGQRLSKPGGDLGTRAKLEQDRNDARAALDRAKDLLQQLERKTSESEILKAPRPGTIMGAPKKEDINRPWDKQEGQPFCKVGDPKTLRILVGVTAADYREIRQNLDRVKAEHPDAPYLEVSILAKNRSDHEFKGRVTRVPDTDEKNLPLALTHRGGGSIAVKPNSDPKVNQPMIQTFLIPVEVDDPDSTLVPGTVAMAKIHMQWRSGAWWAWRSIASALDIGLW